MIPLTEPEIRRLLAAIVRPRLPFTERILLWSHGRREREAHTGACHYRKREPDAQL